MDMFDYYGEVCKVSETPTSAPTGAFSTMAPSGTAMSIPPSGFDFSLYPVTVRSLPLLYSGFDSTGLSNDEVVQAQRVTCELMIGYVRNRFPRSVYSRKCNVISRDDGPVLHFSLTVNFRDTPTDEETDLLSLLQTFFVTRQSDVLQAFSDLPTTNRFHRTSRVFAKMSPQNE